MIKQIIISGILSTIFLFTSIAVFGTSLGGGTLGGAFSAGLKNLLIPEGRFGWIIIGFSFLLSAIMRLIFGKVGLIFQNYMFLVLMLFMLGGFYLT